jgi:tetratricopeptide (TPR) repeat protein
VRERRDRASWRAVASFSTLAIFCWSLGAPAQATHHETGSALDSMARRLASVGTGESRAQSIILWHRAAALYLSGGLTKKAGEALHRLGEAYLDAGEFDSARTILSRALRLRRPNTIEGAWTLLDMSRVMESLSRYDSASKFAKRALSTQRHLGNTIGEAAAIFQLGQIDASQGRTAQALTEYHQVLRLQRKAHDVSGEGRALAAVATLYADAGRLDSAGHYGEGALKRFNEAGDRAAQAWTLTSLAQVKSGLGDTAQAITVLDSALKIQRAIGDHAGEAASLHEMGDLSFAVDSVARAETNYRLALELEQRTHFRSAEAWSLQGLGNVFRLSQRPDSALGYFKRAAEVQRAVKNYQGEASALSAVAGIYRDNAERFAGARAFATSYFERAAAAFRTVLEYAGSDANRIGFEEQQRETFTFWALSWLDRAGSDGVDSQTAISAAFAVSERGRAQALRALMRRGGGATQRPNAVADTSLDGSDATGRRLAGEADTLLAPYRSSHAVVLSYLLAADSLVTWLLAADGTLRVAVHPFSSEAYARIDSVYARLGVPLASPAAHDRVGATAKALAPAPANSRGVGLDPTSSVQLDSLLGHLSRLLLPDELQLLPPGQELLIVPSGTLSRVPFALLRAGSDSAMLGQRAALRYGPSVFALNSADHRGRAIPSTDAKTRAATLGRSLIVGGPLMPRSDLGSTTDRALPPLRWALEEATVVGRMLGAPILTGRNATETTVKRRLASAPIIHLATHGVIFDDEARAPTSFIALAADGVADGHLTLKELSETTTPLAADLVVLSACRTATGVAKQSEGMLSFPRALLAKGARSVLVSLWSVDDEATQVLIREFYAHWLHDADRPTLTESLRRAQAALRRTPGHPEWEDPYYWAAFELVGAS